jgi:radical SAM superfamily enzyme YgiQ (UPF0313 family)
VDEIAELMRDYNFTWESFARADHLTSDMLRKMKESGCEKLRFGVESGDDRILESYEKGVSTKQIKEVFDNCRKLGIKTIAYLCLGTPAENEESFQKTLSFMKEIKPTFVTPALFRPFPGTTMSETVKKENLCKVDYFDATVYGQASGHSAVCKTREMEQKDIERWYREIKKLSYSGSFKARRLLQSNEKSKILRNFVAKKLSD